jgi:hypothetical protein
MVRRLAVALVCVAAATGVSAQPQPRRAVSLSTLLAYPAFYHQRPIVTLGVLTRRDNGDLQLTGGPTPMLVVFSGNTPNGPSEVRGEFWDVGRMNADDPRFVALDVRKTFHFDPDNGWPHAGQVTAIIATAVAPAAPPLSTVRGLVLNPSHYADQKVTVVGQFAGRNLLGELPDAPGQSAYDFVLRSADAAIWVTNLRPRGRDFELSLDTRIDTGRWIQVTGTLQSGRGLQWIDATGGRVTLVASPPADAAASAPDDSVRVPAAPPPEVIFSAPAMDESDVPQTQSVRVQFSRDLDASTLKDRVRVHYVDEEARVLGEPDTPVAHFTVQYVAATRVLEIKFTDPLVRYRTIKV